MKNKIPYDKSKHYNLLMAENKKNSKKKKVRFSLFQAESLDEIKNLRKIREEQLKEFLITKERTNEFSKNNLSKEKERLKNNTNNINKINTNNQINPYTMLEKLNSALEDSTSYQQSNRTAFFNNNYNIRNIKNNTMSEQDISQQLKELAAIKKEKEELEKLNKTTQEQLKQLMQIKKEKEELERLNNEKDSQINKLKLMQSNSEKDNINLSLSESYNITNIKNEDNKDSVVIKSNIENEIDIKLKKEKYKTFIRSIISIISPIIQSNIKYYGSILFEQLNEKLKLLNSEYLNTDNPEYKKYLYNIILYIKEKAISAFLYNVRERIYKKALHNSYKNKAKKYAAYLIYKKKALIFGALMNFAEKQKQWILRIRADLSKSLMWKCFDSLKLYVNYKKIKKYLQQKKTHIILEAIKNYYRETIELNKNANRVLLIFHYKDFFKKAKGNVLIKKGKEVNEKLANEFNTQNLMKKIFNLIKNYYKYQKEKSIKRKKIFINKHEKKEYINIKITEKEVVNYQNNNTIKKVSRKSNVV